MGRVNEMINSHDEGWGTYNAKEASNNVAHTSDTQKTSNVSVLFPH